MCSLEYIGSKNLIGLPEGDPTDILVAMREVGRDVAHSRHFVCIPLESRKYHGHTTIMSMKLSKIILITQGTTRSCKK